MRRPIPPIFGMTDNTTEEQRNLALAQTRSVLIQLKDLCLGIGLKLDQLDLVAHIYQTNLMSISSDESMAKNDARTKKITEIVKVKLKGAKKSWSPGLGDYADPMGGIMMMPPGGMMVPPSDLMEINNLSDEDLEAEYQRVVVNRPKPVGELAKIDQLTDET